MTIDYASLSRVVCLANGKGGVSKTSITANIAGLAAAAGYRTLIVDLDPQGDLSDDLGYYDNRNDDHGKTLSTALITGQPMTPNLVAVRTNLDVITGGEHLSDIAGALVARYSRGASTTDLLAQTLAGLAVRYDLVLIDTPPVDVNLQLLALGAARWILIPTKADASSIRGIRRIAERVVETRTDAHVIEILGVVLTGVPTTATRVREGAKADIMAVLGDSAPLFDTTLRNSDAVARESRDKGVLVHELAEKIQGAEPFWKPLREGRIPERLPGSAPALADDYIRLTEQVLLRLNELESGRGAA